MIKLITGSEEESRKLMMNAAIKIVAERGFEGFTTKRWAATAGVAEGSLYYHFKSKNDLLDQTFFYIDEEIADLYSDVTDVYKDMKSPKELSVYLIDGWKRYYNYLVSNPERTLFYYRYLTSPRYNEKVQKNQFAYFASFQKWVKGNEALNDIRKKVNWNVLWTYIVETTVSFAFRIVTGGIENTEENAKQMVMLSMHGLFGILSDDPVSKEQQGENKRED
jgi:AcrR family transcriptional regulator